MLYLDGHVALSGRRLMLERLRMHWGCGHVIGRGVTAHLAWRGLVALGHLGEVHVFATVRRIKMERVKLIY